MKDIGEILIDAFAVVRKLRKREIISICLTELLNPDRNLKRHDLLDFIVNQIEKPEEEILSVFKKYEIVHSVKIYCEAFTKFSTGKEALTKFSTGNTDIVANKSLSIFQPFTYLKYSPIVYRYTVVKFGAQSKAAKHLMNEVTSVRIAITLMTEVLSHQVLTSLRWLDSITIFNEY